MFAMLAIAGQAVLLASSWLLPLASEFSLVGDNISEMVLGRFGFVQTAAFVIAGLGTLALAYVIRQLTLGVRGSGAGSLLVAVYGVGAVLVALFPTDRIDSAADVWSQSTIGMIHIGVSAVSFLCMIIAMFVLTWTFARAANWRSLTVWSALFAGAALSLFLGQGEGPWVGILQRALVTAISGWMVMAAFRARRIAALDGAP